jgi:anthranilate synthase component I
VQIDASVLLGLHAANPERYPVLLESTATGGTLGAYSILLAFPGDRLALQVGGRLTGNAPVALTGTFLDAVDRWWQHERLPESQGTLPFTGGWFLFLGYEVAAQIEPSLRLPAASGPPIAMAIRIPAAVVLAHATGEGWLLAEQGNEPAITAMQGDLRSLAARPQSPSLDSRPLLCGQIEEDPPEQFLQAVGSALEHIAAGDIYQANLSRAWSASLGQRVQPIDVYRRLRRANPAPFAGLAVLGPRAIVSSSPERLLAVRERRISTRPIAGTRPRGGNALADRGLARELRQHPKERAEHVMLIDLERNDLGRVCVPGSVEVNEYMSLESYARVHHIVSNVRGTLRPEVTPVQAIAAVFPGGTITGCPKIRCMQLIGDLEGVPRTVYTGSMGYLNRDGSLDLNILIRTLDLADRRLRFRAGAGIVADSIARHELEETRAKAQGMLDALRSPELS